MQLNWEKQSEEFNQVWENRHQLPVVTTNWVNNDWAKGRTNYLVFLLRLIDRHIIDCLKELQTELAVFACIDPFPSEYFHITVKEGGCFLVSQKRRRDEFTKEELPALIKAAHDQLNTFQPFTLRLENLNHFRSTVCVQAHDGGVIRNINGALLQIPGIQMLKTDYPRFLPHLSIAQFKSTEQHDLLITFLEKQREMTVGPLTVDTIQLVIAQLPRYGRYPQLKTLDTLTLK